MKKEKLPRITRIKVDMNDPSTFPKSTINKELIDTTTEEDISLRDIQKLDFWLYLRPIWIFIFK